MSQNHVKVCVRTRPTQYFALENILIDQQENTIQINTVNDEPTAGVLNNRTSNYKFKFDHVFHNATQSDIYELYARDTVNGVMDGINGE